MKMRAMKKVGTMQLPGHYRPPQLAIPGSYNRPRIGRVGKQMPMPRVKMLKTMPRFPYASTRRGY